MSASPAAACLTPDASPPSSATSVAKALTTRASRRASRVFFRTKYLRGRRVQKGRGPAARTFPRVAADETETGLRRRRRPPDARARFWIFKHAPIVIVVAPALADSAVMPGVSAWSLSRSAWYHICSASFAMYLRGSFLWRSDQGRRPRFNGGRTTGETRRREAGPTVQRRERPAEPGFVSRSPREREFDAAVGALSAS